MRYNKRRYHVIPFTDLTESMITLYGIKNCDTVKKARQWLQANAIDFKFHDFRDDGLTSLQVQQWVRELGWEKLINKRSASWKTLSEENKSRLNAESAVELILAAPTLIKRPLLDTGKHRHTGFNVAEYQSLLLK